MSRYVLPPSGRLVVLVKDTASLVKDTARDSLCLTYITDLCSQCESLGVKKKLG